MKTFYLIDGHSQIFRAYYAPSPPLTAPSGEPVKATIIFTQMVLAILRDHKPDYLAVAIDLEDSTRGRTEAFADYKKNREETPEDLSPQVDRILDIVSAMGIPIYRKSGYEADDVIASIANQLRGRDVELRVVSRDKDLYQVLDDHVRLWDPLKDELIDARRLEETLGFTPAQAVEIQTLTGDSIDNIPGIPGVGPKTAAKLIQKYGTADEVLAHAEEQTPKLRENLKTYADRIPVARTLVTLDRGLDVGLDLEDCRVGPLDDSRIRPIFEELRLRRLLDQLDSMHAAHVEEEDHGAREPVSPPENGEESRLDVAPSSRWALVDSEAALQDCLSHLRRVRALAVDTETTSLRAADCELVGVSLSWKEGEAWYLPVRSRAGKALPPSTVVEALRPCLEDPSIRKCGQNLKYDIQVLRTEGIELQGAVFDSMVASYLLRPEQRGHDIDTLAREFLGLQKIPTKDLIGSGQQQISMLDVDTRKLADYACEDADVAWRLWTKLGPQIDESPMKALFEDVEMPLIHVLADMEYAGVRIDTDLLQRLKETLGARIDELRSAIHAAAGRDFLVDSPKQLAQVLFDEQGLRVVKKTKTGRSTDAEVLETLVVETEHPLPGLVLRYRELHKLLGTYVEPLPRLVSPRTGRLHASFHQAVAATGRLSSSDPNIQNIPVRSAEGREIRKAFVAGDPDHVLVTADYSQIELRILAHFSRDAALVEAFQEDRDIHGFVAAQIAGIPQDQVTRKQRSQAKAVNFGIIYGQGPFGLARQLGISKAEASEFISRYKKQYPGIVTFMDQCIAQAEATGKVTTLLGRQRPIPEIVSRNRTRRALGERLAINTVIQGTAADMIKIAMVRVHRRLAGSRIGARLLIQVHDELVLEAPRQRVEEVVELVRAEMVDALPLSVPVRVDVASGDDWLAAGDRG